MFHIMKKVPVRRTGGRTSIYHHKRSTEYNCIVFTVISSDVPLIFATGLDNYFCSKSRCKPFSLLPSNIFDDFRG